MNKQTFIVSLITQDNDYQIEQASAAEEMAHRLGVDVHVIFADNDSIQQSQQLLKFIQSGPVPNGIILESVGGTALPQVARAAASAGIGWVVLNRHADYVHDLRRNYKVPVFTVNADNEEVGRIQGRQLETLLPEGGSVLYIQGPSDSLVCQARTDGLMKTKPLSLQLKMIRGQWTEASAYKAVNAWLRLSTSQQAHIDAVVAQNDAMAMGSRKAFQEVSDHDARQRWLSLPYLGCDGVPKTGQAWVRNTSLAATVVIPPLAGQSLDMLVTAIRTGAMPPEITQVTPHPFPALETLEKGQFGKTRAATGTS
jgi:ABC-type sugar transport system substrate-binding protein